MDDFYELNELGVEIIDRINGVNSVEIIIKELLLIYSVDTDILKSDVSKFITFLLDIDAIEAVEV